jgi:hypothetical protein
MNLVSASVLCLQTLPSPFRLGVLCALCVKQLASSYPVTHANTSCSRFRAAAR